MALTLPEDLDRAIFNLADAVGKPAAQVVTQLLQEMVPQLEGLAKIHRATREGNKVAAKRALQHMMGDTMAEVIASTQPDMFPVKKARKS